MTTRRFLILCLTVLGSTTAWAQPAGDDAAIREVVRRYQDARERRDKDALVALFTSDADQLVSSGEWRRGREAVVTGGLASSARGGSRALTVETVRRLGPDVAIADARYEINNPAGGGATRNMWSSFVLQRQPDGWRISAIRNMLPAPQ